VVHGDWARPHLCKLAWHGFSRDHVWRGRSKPGCRIVGSVTIVWLTTEADEILTVSTEVMSYCNCYCYYYTGKHSTHSQQQHQYFTKSAKQITPNRKLWLTKPNNKKICVVTARCSVTFYRIWQCDEQWPPTADQPVNIISENPIQFSRIALTEYTVIDHTDRQKHWNSRTASKHEEHHRVEENFVFLFIYWLGKNLHKANTNN